MNFQCEDEVAVLLAVAEVHKEKNSHRMKKKESFPKGFTCVCKNIYPFFRQVRSGQEGVRVL